MRVKVSFKIDPAYMEAFAFMRELIKRENKPLLNKDDSMFLFDAGADLILHMMANCVDCFAHNLTNPPLIKSMIYSLDRMRKYFSDYFYDDGQPKPDEELPKDD